MNLFFINFKKNIKVLNDEVICNDSGMFVFISEMNYCIIMNLKFVV